MLSSLLQEKDKTRGTWAVTNKTHLKVRKREVVTYSMIVTE